MKCLFGVFLITYLASLSCTNAFSERLLQEQVSMSIQMNKSVYRVYEDIPFEVILTPQINGELITWNTASVYVEVYKLVGAASSQNFVFDNGDEVILSDLDMRVENATIIPGGDDNEWGITVYPKPEFVAVNAGAPYIKNATFVEDVYPSAQGDATFLYPGRYKMDIEYSLSISTDADYESESYAQKRANIDFQITTSGDEAAAIAYWLSVLRDTDATKQAVMSAWEALSTYTDQILSPHSANKMDLGVRELAATEHSNWWQHYQSQLTLTVDDEENEILQLPEGVACRCIHGPEVKNYGDAVRTTSAATIDLAGDVGVGRRGVRFITISNNRFPDNPSVQGTRPTYVTWQATAIPLAEGENVLTITAEDYIGDRLTTTLRVNRTDD